MINNLKNVEIEGLDSKDYPNFHKAYVAYAENSEGIPCTQRQLDAVNRVFTNLNEVLEISGFL